MFARILALVASLHLALAGGVSAGAVQTGFLADTQTLICDHGLTEGSLGHALLHGTVGCAFAEVSGGDCRAGFAAGAAASLYSGTLDITDPSFDRSAALNTAELLGAFAGFVFSSGKGENVSLAGSVSQSAVDNNYLSHQEEGERIKARLALEACEQNGNCSESEIEDLKATISYWTVLDEQRDAALRAACDSNSASSECHALLLDAMLRIGMAAYGPLEALANMDFSGTYSEAYARYLEYGEEQTGESGWDDLARKQRYFLEEYNSTLGLLALYEEDRVRAGTLHALMGMFEGGLIVGGGYLGRERPGGATAAATTEGVLLGESGFVKSATVQRGTTIQLSEDLVTSQRTIPKGWLATEIDGHVVFRPPGPPTSQHVVMRTGAAEVAALPPPRGRLTGSMNGLQSHEWAFVETELAAGRNIEIVPVSNIQGVRTNDFLIDGQKVELKTVSGIQNTTSDGISAAMSSRIMDARGQSPVIVLDMRGQAGVTEEIARRGIIRALNSDTKTGMKIHSVRVIGPDFDITVPRVLE